MFDDPTKSGESLLDQTDNIFLLIYTVELTLKLFAFGLWGRKTSFFNNYWNILDFFIVLTSLLDYTLSGLVSINLSALRSLRVLRPLRTISSVRKLKNLVQTIFSALPLLIDVVIITYFYLFIFAIAGLHLFQGALDGQCYNSSTNSYIYLPITGNNQYCSDSTSCPDGYICQAQPYSLNHGASSFNNIFMSFV